MNECLFCKIINNKIPSKKVYEDDKILAFYDINKQAPIHVLIIPKKHIKSLAHLEENDKDIIAHLTHKIQMIALLLDLKSGFNIKINTGSAGGQEIYHLHYHLLGKNK